MWAISRQVKADGDKALRVGHAPIGPAGSGDDCDC